MKRVKSTPEDEKVLFDETAEATDRISAAGRLAFDGFQDLLYPITIQWLNDSNSMLRERAISLLLKRWGDEKYFERAIEMLHYDGDWVTRKTAADTLVYFANKFEEGKKYQDKVMQELLTSILRDEDETVQRKSYEGLYELIKNERLRDDKDYFNRQTDVDWNLLEPYLKKYNLQRSH